MHRHHREMHGLPHYSIQLKHRIERSLELVRAWIRGHKYQAYEPADGNLSWLFPLTRGRVLPMRMLQQIVLRAPVNIRPLLGISPHESAIGRGYLAWGYLLLHSLTGDDKARHEAIDCLDWLMANRFAGATEFSWGDPYEYATRAGRRPYGEPILVWTAFIGEAFLEAYDLIVDQSHLRVAESIGRWILALPRQFTDTGNCLSYAAHRQSFIHNANVVGAAYLAHLAQVTSSHEMLAVAKSAMAYTCSRQKPDGSWHYAEDRGYHWIDNFHTAYNLSALANYRNTTQDHCFDHYLSRGRQFYKSHFFESDGRPKYFHNKTYPTDIQCAAQAIDTLATLAEDDPDCLMLATRVAEWTIDNMQGEDGHFYFRDLGWTKVTTPLLHWGQATMVKALAVLLQKLALSQGCVVPASQESRVAAR